MILPSLAGELITEVGICCCVRRTLQWMFQHAISLHAKGLYLSRWSLYRGSAVLLCPTGDDGQLLCSWMTSHVLARVGLPHRHWIQVQWMCVVLFCLIPLIQNFMGDIRISSLRRTQTFIDRHYCYISTLDVQLRHSCRTSKLSNKTYFYTVKVLKFGSAMLLVLQCTSWDGYSERLRQHSCTCNYKTLAHGRTCSGWPPFEEE